MGQLSQIFNALSVGAYCLLAYPGIFSGLSNDDKLSPALLYSIAPSPIGLLSSLSIIFEEESLLLKLRVEPKLFVPGKPICQCMSFLFKRNFAGS